MPSVTLGANTITAVATGVGGETGTGSITITRKAGPAVAVEPLKGKGCSAAGFSGFELLALLTLGPTLRRRRVSA